MKTLYSLLFSFLVVGLLQFGCAHAIAADSFQSALSAEIKKVPAKQRSWFTSVVSDDFETAVGSWDVVRSQAGAKHQSLANISYIYSLFRMGLYQSLVEELVSPSATWTQNALAADLQKWLAPQLDQILLQTGVLISTDVRTNILAANLVNKELKNTLLSYAFLNDPAELVKILPALEKSNQILKPASIKAVSYLAAQGKVTEALKIAQLVSNNNLSLARLYFQEGQLDKAVDAYERVSRQDDLFPESREELGWTYLRMNDIGGLRGLTSQLTKLDSIAERPESYVLQAISNLKVCNFEGANLDIHYFTKEMNPVARKMDSILKLDRPPVPTRVDLWTQLVQRRLVLLQKEIENWANLEEGKIQQRMESYKAQTQADLLANYKRQWVNESKMLEEAIIKMRFVKLEYLSQIRRLEQYQSRPHLLSKNLLNKESQLADSSVQGSLRALDAAEKDRMVFLADGAMWSDEVYRLRSLTPSDCVRFLQATQPQGVKQ